MYVCVWCRRPPDEHSKGFMFSPVAFARGLKSGLPYKEEEVFIDGEAQKYMCFDCMNVYFPELLSAMNWEAC